MSQKWRTSMNDLRLRIAQALGWPVHQTYGFSLPALREIARTADPKLADELDKVIRSGKPFRIS